jgi:peptide/nickel transport system substrate-binding protein
LALKSQGAEKFKAIDVIDDYTVRINLSEWDSTVTSSLTQALGLIISPAAYQKNGEAWAMNNPVGTGPFQFVSWEKDVRITYKKFDHYWQKGKPYLDGITWTPITDQMTRQMSFRKGELDIIYSVAAKDLAGLEKDGFVVKRARVGSGPHALIPDSANPHSPFADVRVRRAAAYAIDRAGIAKTIFYGEVEPATQFVFKGHWGYNDTVSGYPYNPAKAKQLLKEAGYPNGFKTKLLYRTNPEFDQLFTVVQGYLRAVGIDAELDPMQSGRYDQYFTGGSNWEGLLLSSGSSNTDAAATLSIRFAGGGKFFSSMLVPNDYAKAIQNAVTARNFKDKQKWTRKVMELMFDKYCLQIPIYCSSDFAVSTTSVHGSGIMENPEMVAIWSPADAWLER